MSEFIEVSCGQCGERFCLLKTTHAALKRSSVTFFCPWGHQRHYPQGPTEAEKLRQERDRLKQNAAYLEDRVRQEREAREASDRRASAARGQVTKLKKRAAAGVCPCCNRQFADLHRHMQTKHKGFLAEEVQSEVGKTIQ